MSIDEIAILVLTAVACTALLALAFAMGWYTRKHPDEPVPGLLLVGAGVGVLADAVASAWRWVRRPKP